MDDGLRGPGEDEGEEAEDGGVALGGPRVVRGRGLEVSLQRRHGGREHRPGPGLQPLRRQHLLHRRRHRHQPPRLGLRAPPVLRLRSRRVVASRQERDVPLPRTRGGRAGSLSDIGGGSGSAPGLERQPAPAPRAPGPPRAPPPGPASPSRRHRASPFHGGSRWARSPPTLWWEGGRPGPSAPPLASPSPPGCQSGERRLAAAAALWQFCLVWAIWFGAGSRVRGGGPGAVHPGGRMGAGMGPREISRVDPRLGPRHPPGSPSGPNPANSRTQVVQSPPRQTEGRRCPRPQGLAEGRGAGGERGGVGRPAGSGTRPPPCCASGWRGSGGG